MRRLVSLIVLFGFLLALPAFVPLHFYQVDGEVIATLDVCSKGGPAPIGDSGPTLVEPAFSLSSMESGESTFEEQPLKVYVYYGSPLVKPPVVPSVFS